MNRLKPESSLRPISGKLPSTKKLDTDFRIGLHRGGPVVVSRLRKLLNDIDGLEGKPSFLAMYRRFGRVARNASQGRLGRLQKTVSAATKENEEDEGHSLICVHEIAHVAIPIYYKSGVHSYPVRFFPGPDKLGGVFEFGDLGWNHKITLDILQTVDAEVRPLLVESCERVLCCDLAGEVAHAILLTEEPPPFALPAKDDPGSDVFKVKSLVREIRGFDDEEYQLKLQTRCAEILMHPRMWEAVIVAASFLYERKVMDGADVEDIFRALSAPQFDFGNADSHHRVGIGSDRNWPTTNTK